MALANHRLAPEIEVIALITSEDHSFYPPQLSVKSRLSMGMFLRWFRNSSQTPSINALMICQNIKRSRH